MKPNKNYYDSLYSKYYDEISEKRRDVKTITRTLATLIGNWQKKESVGDRSWYRFVHSRTS